MMKTMLMMKRNSTLVFYQRRNFFAGFLFDRMGKLPRQQVMQHYLLSLRKCVRHHIVWTISLLPVCTAFEIPASGTADEIYRWTRGCRSLWLELADVLEVLTAPIHVIFFRICHGPGWFEAGRFHL